MDEKEPSRTALGAAAYRAAHQTVEGGTSLAIAWPLTSYAQDPKQPLKRVGYLATYVPCPLRRDNPIVRRLGELGWIERQTFVSECVSTVGRLDQLPELARELVSRRPDVLIAGNYLLVSALKQETTTIGAREAIDGRCHAVLS